MTDTPWTPGPWEIRTNAPARPTQQFIANADDTWVADVAGSNHEPEHRSNARLIAAAPEMAELLAEWVDRARVPSIRVERETRALLARIRGEAETDQKGEHDA